MTKHMQITYEAPAIVSITFAIDRAEWEALDDGHKVAFIQNKMRGIGDGTIDDEGSSAFITDRTVSLSRLQIEEEEAVEWDEPIQEEETFSIVYPEERTVSTETIRLWYEDAVANGEVEKTTADASAMAKALDDAGIITLGKARTTSLRWNLWATSDSDPDAHD